MPIGPEVFAVIHHKTYLTGGNKFQFLILNFRLIRTFKIGRTGYGIMFADRRNLSWLIEYPVFEFPFNFIRTKFFSRVRERTMWNLEMDFWGFRR